MPTIESPCIPVCANCVAAGKCLTDWTPKVPSVLNGRQHYSATPKAVRHVAIEKGLSRYIRLTCEHLTTREEQEFVVYWRPKRGTYWCPQCNKWLSAQAPAPKPVYSENPRELF